MDDVQNPQAAQPVIEEASPQAPFYLLPNEQVAPQLQTQSGTQPGVIPVGASQVNVNPAPVQQAAPKPVDVSQFAKPQVTQTPQVVQQPQVEQQNLLGTYGTQQRANTAIANAAAQKSALNEMALAEQEDQLKQSMLRQEKIKQDFDNVFKERVGYLDDISKQLASQDFTNAKLDKDRFWSNQSTGQKILGGIALALGAIGGGISGKQNMAMEVINKAIDRDIEEQKYNIQQNQDAQKMKAQNLRDQSSLGQNMLSNFRAKFGDDLQAEAALRSLMIQQTQNKLAQIAANTESKTVLENAKFINAQLEREKQNAALEMKSRLASSTALQNLGTQGWENLSPVQKAMIPEDIRKQFEAQQERSAPGWIGAAPTKEVAAKFIEKQNETQPAIDGVNRVLALTSGDEYSKLSPESRAKVSTELVALIGALRVPFTGPGAMTDKEFERLQDTLGNPNKLLTMPSWQKVKLQTVLNKLNNDLETAASNSGFRRRPKANIPMRPYGK
jgi:hypothetical protein